MAVGAVVVMPRTYGRDRPSPSALRWLVPRPEVLGLLALASTRPWRTAKRAAWVRSVRCSLLSTDDTWVFTVFSATNSLAASSLLVRPSPSRASTSRSRAVSWSRPASAPAGWVTSERTRVATAGSSTDPPRCTVRIADSSSAGGTSLPSHPAAPARTAARAWSSAPKLVSTITRGAGSSASRRGRAATPPPPGITRSSSTTSGCSERAAATALSTSAASPTTSSPSREPR